MRKPCLTAWQELGGSVNVDSNGIKEMDGLVVLICHSDSFFFLTIFLDLFFLWLTYHGEQNTTSILPL